MKRRELTVFFVLTFGYPWSLGALYGLFPVEMIAMFGPISFSNPLAFTAVWAPTLSAIIVSALRGRAGLRDLFERLFRWNFGISWYAIAVLGIAVVGLTARYMSAAVAGTPAPPIFDFGQWHAWIVAGGIAFIADPGPLGEELGWRGFALPRMLERWNGLTAAIVPAKVNRGMPLIRQVGIER